MRSYRHQQSGEPTSTRGIVLEDVGKLAASELKNCINQCLDCQSTCTETIKHCLAKGGDLNDEECVSKLMDCSDICHVTANSMIRASNLFQHTVRICASICEECARTCEQWEDDEQMSYCAEVCRRCQEACEIAVAGIA